MNFTTRELASMRTDANKILVDTAYIYDPPDPNTATRNSRGEISQKYPDAWLSVIGGVAITAGHAGTGYVANDVVALTGGDGLARVKVLTVAAITGAVLTLQLTVAGSGYSMDSYAVTGGTGTGLKVTVTPKPYSFRADELPRYYTEDAMAGQVQASSLYELAFPAGTPARITSRIVPVTSLFNPDLVGRTFNVLHAPESTTEVFHTVRCQLLGL